MDEVKKCFEWAIKDGLLRFTQSNGWLTVEYKDVLTGESTNHKSNWRWKLLCAQDLRDYCFPLTEYPDGVIDTLKLVNRITLMLADQLRRKAQDVNILMIENGARVR